MPYLHFRTLRGAPPAPTSSFEPTNGEVDHVVLMPADYSAQMSRLKAARSETTRRETNAAALALYDWEGCRPSACRMQLHSN